MDRNPLMGPLREMKSFEALCFSQKMLLSNANTIDVYIILGKENTRDGARLPIISHHQPLPGFISLGIS
jgi:hypothetical protein